MIRRAIIVLGLMSLFAACSGPPAASGAGAGAGTVVHGTVNVPAFEGSTASNCAPWTDWTDVVPGTKVTITNQSGDIVGATTLTRPASGGLVPHTPAAGADLLGSLWDKSCVYAFEAPIQGEATFFTVKIGSREGPTVSRSEMDAKGWNFALEIGPT